MLFTLPLQCFHSFLILLSYNEDNTKRECLFMSQIKERYVLTSSQKMMVFILSMSLYGLSNMITELVPSVYLGTIEFSIVYFAFILFILCMLFLFFNVAVFVAHC